MVAEVSAVDAWEATAADAEARLVDVRTPEEWSTVGVPDVAGLIRVSWVFAGGVPNAAFLRELAGAGAGPGHRLYFICRSGVRSLAAAREAEAAGYWTANVAAGFEAPGGWVASGLPAVRD